MQRRLVLASLVFSFIPTMTSPAWGADLSIKPGDQRVMVDIRNAAQLQTLLDMDLDIHSHEFGVGPIDVHVSIAERKRLEAAGLSYSVINPDMMKTDQEEKAAYQRYLQRAQRGLATPFDSYLPLADMITFINNLAAARPDLCEVIDIGNSLEGRDIWVLHITGTGADPKPGVFYHGLQHSREWITGPTVLYLADYLVNNYDTDTCIRELVNTTDFYLAPCVNPDGYNYTWTTTRLWRKNRRNNGNGTFGVDLNRNWGYQWGFDNSGSSNVPSNETYRGTAPFSEPETQVLRDFINAHPNIRAYMDYHSYSQLILWPYGYANVLAPEPDRSKFDFVGGRMQELIQGVHGRAYVPGPIWSTIYPANGGSADWVYGSAGRYGFSIELRGPESDPNGFQLPAAEIIPNCEENLPAILFLSRWASQGLTLDVPGGTPPSIQDGQPATLTFQVADAQETYAAGTATGYYRLSPSDPFTSVAASALGGGLFSVTIPGAPCGSTVEAYFTAQGSGGYLAKYPCDAPTSLISMSVIHQELDFADDLEANLGWTVGDTGDNATTGVWVRVNPVGTAAQPEDDHTGAPGVTCWVTGQGAVGGGLGDNDVDAGKTTLKTPVHDLSGQTDPVIGYWRWYSNSTGGDPNADVFKVDISNNNGGSWVNVETVGPAGSGTGGGWIYHEFHVSNFVAPTSQVLLRFVAADLSTGSLIEAAVDDFAIFELGCLCGTFPGDADGSGVLDGNDINAFAGSMTNSPFYTPCCDLAAPFTAPLDDADLDALVELLLAQ